MTTDTVSLVDRLEAVRERRRDWASEHPVQHAVAVAFQGAVLFAAVHVAMGDPDVGLYGALPFGVLFVLLRALIFGWPLPAAR